MIIGITGRGGSGKSTIARYLCSKNPTYKYIEVDNLVEKKVFKSKRLLEKVNKYYKDKKYDINDIVSCYFKADEKRKIRRDWHDLFSLLGQSGESSSYMQWNRGSQCESAQKQYDCFL